MSNKQQQAHLDSAKEVVEEDPQQGEEAADTATAQMEETTTAAGKARALLGLMTKFIGVKDMISLRISLPSSFLDPVSNLEYWNYMDRPDFFMEIPDPDDPVDRILKVVKWWLSKDVKWLPGKIPKPYNSILGEQFICHYDISPETIKASMKDAVTESLLRPFSTSAETAKQSQNMEETMKHSHDSADNLRVHTIIEQISHHPPVSAFYHYNKEKDICCRGIDQVSAKFTGTAVKIFPGPYNKGVYITLGKRDNEEYFLEHPSAYINGWLRANLYVVAAEQTVISCPKSGIRCVIEYKDEPFFGGPKFLIEGKVFKYNPNDDTQLKTSGKRYQLNKIPEEHTLCHLTGCWKGQVCYLKTTKADEFLPKDLPKPFIAYPRTSAPDILLDMQVLDTFPKHVAPLEEQQQNESRKIWQHVTEAITLGQFQQATKLKRELEGNQRAKAAERKRNNEVFRSFWFGFKDPDAIGGSPGDLLTRLDGPFIAGKPYLLADREKDLPWNMST